MTLRRLPRVGIALVLALGGVLLPLAWGAVPGSTFAALLALTTLSAGWFAIGTVFAPKPVPAPEPIPVTVS